MDELELNDGEINKTEERIKTLSSKVRTTAEERDAANAKVAEEAAGRVNAEKERDFYSGFTDTITKYPGASEHKDAIKEKVMAGYSVEDATVSVLNKEGKLTAAPPPAPPPPGPAAGGSAPNGPMGADKSVYEMTPEERKAAFKDAVARGDITLT